MNQARVHAASSGGALRVALSSRSSAASLIASEKTANAEARRRCASPREGPWLRWHVNDLATRVNLLEVAIAALCFSLLAPPALAQQAGALNGEWMATYQTKTGVERQALVTIADDGGSWKDMARGQQERKNACLGKIFPLHVEAKPNGRIKMDVSGSTVMPDCPDYHFTLNPVDGNTLEGPLKDGRTIKLVRR
jgi:hypothetical protein